MSTVADLIAAALDEQQMEYERTPAGGFVVTLPGFHKQKTLCNLVIGEHALRVEAFVMRRPDENHLGVHEFLLRRNARMYGVAFSIDTNGDIYLTGRVALHAVTADELDRLLGAVLSYADGTFDQLLELGFASAIRREWAWRVQNEQSLANLAAFASWAAEPGGPTET